MVGADSGNKPRYHCHLDKVDALMRPDWSKPADKQVCIKQKFNTMKITRTSGFTGKTHTHELPVTQAQLDAWHNGELAQRAFPNLSRDEREFIMTGVTPAEWDKVFKNVIPVTKDDYMGKGQFTFDISDKKVNGQDPAITDVLFLKNLATGVEVEFNYLHPDLCNEEIAGWRYQSVDKKYKLLIIND